MDKSYVVFKTYSYNHQAEMDLNKLHNEGIDAYLSDTIMGSSSFMGAAGGVKILVAEEDVERAQEILSDSQSQSDDT